MTPHSPNGRRFVCSICGESFFTRKQLVLHLMRKHAKKPGYGKDEEK